jgi:hypothetical protein
VAYGQQLFATEIGALQEGSVLLLIKAHSRNAVAAGRLATDIKARWHTNKLNVTVELVMYDPVPGPGQSDVNQEINIGTVDRSTLIYSVASGWPVGFTPQKVFGAQRIIVTRQDHQGGIKAGFLYEGDVYKGNRLNYLPEGVYVDTNKQGEATEELERVYDIQTMRAHWETLYKSSSAWTGDTNRKEIVNEVTADALAEPLQVLVQS